MLFTSGPDRAFERLMQEKPGFDHYDSGGADAPEDCGTCRFYRPDWKYQFCRFAECPYQPGKLTDLAAVKFTVKGADDDILSDLHKALLDQHVPEADRVAQALDLYVSGSLNVFNHRTNVDIGNRLVCFDIKELGKQLKKLGMLIVQDQIWGRVTANRSQGKATWYFADEFHLLLKEEQTAAYSAEIWKRFRKWGGIPTGATQNVKDLLSSPEIENILENSDFVTLLNQAAGDRKILAERLNLSAEQQKYIDNSEPGEGLLIFENVVLPFTNPIPQDTQLYRIMTTRLSEVVDV